ncbi:MAG TPA: MlaD family protein [Gammaproteobacteria bacterium]|nr:MlaD family protein [Gammaproteobacteria bacterium]
MERDIHYVTVGIVVILGGIGFFFFVLWLSQGSEGGNAVDYNIYFRGSISGLEEGSQVQYQGVEVGRVVGIDVLKDRPQAVRVHIQIKPQTPINSTTVATSRSVGFTGLAFVGLNTAKAKAPPPKKPPGEAFPVLKSRPSRMEQVFEDLPGVMDRIKALTRRAENLLNKDSQRNFNAILKNTAELTSNLNQRSKELAGLMDRMKGTLNGMDRTFAGAQDTLKAARGLMPETKDTLKHLDAVSRRLDRFTAKHQEDFDQFASEGLESMQRFLEDSRTTLKEIRELTRRLKENPSQLIYQPGSKGVEIPQ